MQQKTKKGKEKKSMGRLRKILAGMIPEYSWVPLILAFSFNSAVYVAARLIAGGWHHYNMESSLDRMVPFWTPAVAVYLGCYLFWAVNYILVARQDKKSVCRFFWSDFIAHVICFVIYLLFPTTNIRPSVRPDGIWNRVMLWVFSVDAADNLFPSIHCMVSWFCFIGVRGRREIPLWYKIFSAVMALMVCASTLFTRQHVILDVFGGVLLAELCFYIGKRKKTGRIYEKILFPAGRKGELNA